MSSVYFGSGTPTGPIDIDESSSVTGSHLKVGYTTPGYAHHIISYRDICFDSMGGTFFFRNTTKAGDPTAITDVLTVTPTLVNVIGGLNVTGALTASGGLTLSGPLTLPGGNLTISNLTTPPAGATTQDLVVDTKTGRIYKQS